MPSRLPDRIADRPPSPWRPAKLSVHGVYARSLTRKRGPNAGKSIKVYDVRFTADGHAFSYTHDRAGWANTHAEQLRKHHALGYLLDPATRRFLTPADPTDAPTFAAFAADRFARQWPGWSPASRRNTQRELATACLLLVRDDAPDLSARDRAAADTYLRRVVLGPPTAPVAPSAADDRWAVWLARWSLPLPDVTPEHLHRLLDTVRTRDITGRRRIVGASTVDRYRVACAAVFNAATAQRIIDWNPWNGVDRSTTDDRDETLDPDLVMAPREVRRLAAACGRIQPRAHAFVLIQGLCGLRPSEAREIQRRDLHLDHSPARVTVRASRTDVADRFLDPGETRRRPLKGRGRNARRLVDVPSHIVGPMREHLDRHVARAADALVFTSSLDA